MTDAEVLRSYEEKIAYLQRDLAQAKEEVQKRDLLYDQERKHHREKTAIAGNMIKSYRQQLESLKDKVQRVSDCFGPAGYPEELEAELAKVNALLEKPSRADLQAYTLTVKPR